MSNMKPILFSTPMVQAILDGRKTMTRRVAKELDGMAMLSFRYVDGDIQEHKGYPLGHVSVTERCRFKPGDVLWVRETWREFSGMLYGREGGVYIPLDDCEGINFKADDAHILTSGANAFCSLFEDIKDDMSYGKWRPSIYMPKAAARIFLRVTGVRVEQVQDISPYDIASEGFSGETDNDGYGDYYVAHPKQEFASYWDSLNAKRGYGWETNPWVWVIAFKRISKEEAYND